MECEDCHVLHTSTYPSMLRYMCQNCHFPDGPAPWVVTHSSRTTGTTGQGYDWDLDCWACHNAHTQYQDKAWLGWQSGDETPLQGKLLRRVLRAQVKNINPDNCTVLNEYCPPLNIIRRVDSNIVEYKGDTEFVDKPGLHIDVAFCDRANGTCSDKAVSGGNYSGPANGGTYTVRVTTGGAVGSSTVDYTSSVSGDPSGNVCSSGGTPCAFDTAFAVGLNGVTVTFTDVGSAGQLTTNNQWKIPIPVGDKAKCALTSCADDALYTQGGVLDGTYTMTVGGTPGTAVLVANATVTYSGLSSGTVCQPGGPVCAFGTPYNIDVPNGVAVTFTDAGLAGQLVAGNVWTLPNAEDDICQVCHEQTQNFNKGTIPANRNIHTQGVSQQPGVKCTSCHKHDVGFKGVGGSCLDCHNTSQPTTPGGYRRQVVDAGGDFERLSHHVTNGTQTQIVAQADCEVCHLQLPAHPGSTGDPQVFLKNADTGAQITYTGTGASVEPFCLSCHDADGAAAGGGLDPFPNPNDNNQPPNIATSWAASSHGTTGVSQLNSDKCMACHGGADSTTTESVTDRNMHGSANATLLSSLVAGESPGNFEEEFCYACHDNDASNPIQARRDDPDPGPASTDIKGLFTDTLAADSTAGYRFTASSGGFVNQRHDVTAADQTYSGSQVECANCHNPHMATSANRNIDPDTPTSLYTETYCNDCTSGNWAEAGNKAYTRDGYTSNFYSTTADYSPMNPVGCAAQPATIGPAVEGVHNGDDLGTSGGTSYTGTEDQTYTVTVSTGGAPPTAQITVTSTGTDSSGPTTVTDFDIPIAVGSFGVTISFNDGGSGGTPASIGPADDLPPANDDSATSGGTYNGLTNGSYTVTVQNTGRARDVTINYTSTVTGETTPGNVCRPSSAGGPQCAYGTPFNVGTKGVTITITDTGARDFVQGDNWKIDVTGPSGDGVLTSGDTWTIAATAATAGCSTDPEPDMITYCLVCHDDNPPADVVMNTTDALENIANAYTGTADQHGPDAGNGGGRGELKAPWHNVGGSWSEAELGQPYASIQCTTCHESHGSDNLFHLRTSMTVRGQVMWVGGQTGSGFEGLTPETIGSKFTAVSDHAWGDTTYVLPCFDGNTQVSCTNPAGVQNEFGWGAWCTFCHDMDSHGQSESNNGCSSGHKHNGGNF